MISGFNVELSKNSISAWEKFHQKGLEMYSDLKRNISSNIEDMIFNDKIDGDSLQNLWFPTDLFKNDKYIFISHSHQDKELAINLAGYLHAKLGVKSFIDSCVWGNIVDLNRQLNDCTLGNEDYCKRCDCQQFSQNLAYVHMMLSSALMTAINKCSYVFFLNTPSSININKKTESPWIYYELNIVNIISANRKTQIAKRKGVYNRTLSESVEFTANIKDMPKLTYKDLWGWEIDYYLSDEKVNPIDLLQKYC